LRERDAESGSAVHQLIMMHHRQQWPHTIQRLERFGHTTRHHNLLTRADKCLHDALEKRRIGSNYENRCH
jgi:hypothetical protein